MSVLAVAAFMLFRTLLSAQVPHLITYQGRALVDGVNFDSESAGHQGLFKFALVKGDGSESYWSNDGTSIAGGEPAEAISLPVNHGLYSVLLGDSSLSSAMTPINAGVLAHADVRLRIWFDDGIHGSQLLSPDLRLAAVAYAVMAGEVPDGSISGAKISPGAVGSTHLGSDSVQGPHIAGGAVDNSKLANSAITIDVGLGIGGGGTVALGGTISLLNNGVTSLAAGEGITISGPAGAVTLGSNAVSANIPGTLIQRDGNGDFSAGVINATHFVGNGEGVTNVHGTLPWQSIVGNTQEASANTGYLANAPALVTIVLPTTVTVGDIVRASGVGGGGWEIVPGGGQSINGFGVGLGPTGSQGASATAQFVGNAKWQMLNESQLAASAVQGSHIAAGAVDNTKLANSSVTLNVGSGLAGGGVLALGGTMELSIPNGGIGSAQLGAESILASHIVPGVVDNTKLANSSVTLNAGSGLAGGGVLILGGTIELSIPPGGIGSAHLAPQAVQSANIATAAVQSAHLAQDAALANLNASSSRQLLGTWDTTWFKGLSLLKPGTGLEKPQLLFDRGIAPKARIYFQGAELDPGWSGLHFSINADRHDADSYIRDSMSLGYSVLNMEYNWLTPQGDHWAEINWTVADSAGFPRRILNMTSSMDDYHGPSNIFLQARTKVLIPEYDTTPGPAFLVEGYQGIGDSLQFIFQNANSASSAAATQIVLRGVGSAGLPSSFSANWAIGTDRFWSGTNNFYLFDGNAGLERLFIDENGKVGLGTVTPSEKLEVNGSAKITGSVSIGGGAATWTQGTSSPDAAEPDGSLYSRVNSGADSGLYVRENGAWVKK